MNRLPPCLAVLVLATMWPAMACAQVRNLLESRCPHCEADLNVHRPSHGFDCPWAVEERIESSLRDLDADFSGGRISSDEMLKRHRALLSNLYAARAAQRRATTATEEKLRREDTDLARRIDEGKRKILNAGTLKNYPPEFLLAKVKELREKSDEATRAGLYKTSMAFRSVASAFEDAAAGNAVSSAAQDSGRAPGRAGEDDPGHRDFEKDPLILGDALDAQLFTNDLRSKLFGSLVNTPAPTDMPSPIDEMNRRIIDNAPGPIGLAGDALNNISGLARVRDSVIENIISRLPSYFEGQLKRLDDQTAEQQVLRSLGQGGSPSTPSPARLRELTESPQTARPPASNSIAPSSVRRLRNLWSDQPADPVTPEAPAAHKPRSLRNLLDP